MERMRTESGEWGVGGGEGKWKKEERESKGESKGVDREEPPAGKYGWCWSIHTLK